MNTSTTKQQFIQNDPRWAAIVKRDSQADDQFYYSVKTTEVYCKPSCASRLAKPENVQFYEHYTAAAQADFRPYQPCKTNLPTWITSKTYATAYRAQRVHSKLCQPPTITTAIFAADYSSNSQFYETSNKLLGMTPANYRAGGANTVIQFAVAECSLGSILVAMSKRGICAILLGDDPNVLVRDLQNRFPQANLIGGDKQFERVIAQVIGFVEAPTIGLDLPLDIQGTAFQQRVWQILRTIPVGTTTSYSDIAQRLGCPKAARAVARACGANTLAVAIPCHRVVRNDGSLSGYRWGIERKRSLLQRELDIVNFTT